MGLIKEGDDYEVLTDIMADEDHLGDMDFKVAGPLNGITALQMDIKTFGITIEIMRNALMKAKKAREHIMSKMMAVLSSPRSEMNTNAPKVYNMIVSENKISDIIGKGGVNIKKICETSKAKVDISQDGKVTIFANNQDELMIAKEMIEASIGKIEFGRIFDAVVKSVMSFGAIVDVGYDRTGLVHVSELSDESIEPSMIIKEGQIVKVKFIGTDNKGRFKFSLKAVNQETGEDISNGEYKQEEPKKRSFNANKSSARGGFNQKKHSKNFKSSKQSVNMNSRKVSKKKSSGLLSIFKKHK
jgi:polyribonucleotide nucleotidyltransferase